MKIYIYDETCTMAGREVPQHIIDAAEDPDRAGDWTAYGGEPAELLAQADALDRTDGAAARANAYLARVASTIRAEVYRYHPDFEPAEAE